MKINRQLIAFATLINRELVRMLRVWVSTLVSPIITTVLYFLIFGHVIGSRVGTIEGYSYLQFISPGLIMMSIINNAYASGVSGFFNMKFARDIEELLVTPMHRWVMLSGFVIAGMLRGMIVGSIVTLIALLFTHLHMHSLSGIILVAILSSAVFSTAGVLNALYAKTFDHINFMTTFVITPLTYLGGVFYSISMLPPVWRYISMANPITYIIHSFRFSVLGIGAYHVWMAYAVMALVFALLFYIAWFCLKRGFGLRF